MNILKALLLIAGITSSAIYAAETLSSVDQQDAAIRRIKKLRSNKTPAARHEIEQLQASIKKLEADRASNNRYQAELADLHKKHLDTHYPRFRALDSEIERLQREYVKEFNKQRTSNQENKEQSSGMIGVWQDFPGLSRRSKVYMTRHHKARIAALEKKASEIGTDPYLQTIDQQLEALQKEQDDLDI